MGLPSLKITSIGIHSWAIAGIANLLSLPLNHHSVGLGQQAQKSSPDL